MPPLNIFSVQYLNIIQLSEGFVCVSQSVFFEDFIDNCLRCVHVGFRPDKKLNAWVNFSFSVSSFCCHS